MTPAQLQKILTISATSAKAWAAPLSRAMHHYGIEGTLREAAFIAQVGHESGRLRYVKEIWGPTPAQARYEGRKDLGNTQQGDGKKYMGRGLIQVTGRANYAAAGMALLGSPSAFLTHPEQLELPDYAALSAAWFWDSRGLNMLADARKFDALTRKINGGLNGIQERRELYARALEVLA